MKQTYLKFAECSFISRLYVNLDVQEYFNYSVLL